MLDGPTTDGVDASGEATGVDGAPDAKRPLLRGWGVVLVVALSAAVAQSFGRFTYGVLLPAIRDDLGVSNSVAGFIGTLNVGAYLIGTLAVAWATVRTTLLRVMRIGFVFSACGLIASALAPNEWVLGPAQFLAGFGGALIWIPAPVIASDALAPERRGLAVGLMGSGIGLGIFASGQLSGIIRSAQGDEGWRTVYAIEAGIAMIVLIVIFTLLTHHQERPASDLRNRDRGKGPGRGGGIAGFGALRRMRGWVPLTMAYTSFGFMYLLVIGFLTTKLEDDNGWTESEASLAFTLLGLAVIVGGPLFITLGRRIGARFAMAIAFTGWSLMAVAILPGWYGPGLVISAAIGMLFAGVPGMITLYVVENTTIEDYGPSFAAATLAFGLAQMLAPQVGGLIADLTGSFTVVFLLSAGFALTGAVASLLLPGPMIDEAEGEPFPAG